MTRRERLAMLCLRLAVVRHAAARGRERAARARVAHGDALATAYEPLIGCHTGLAAASSLRFADRLSSARPALIANADRAVADRTQRAITERRAERALAKVQAAISASDRAHARRRSGITKAKR